MKIFHKNQILTIFLFFYFLVSSNVAESQPKSLMGKAFFYKDIAHFKGPFSKAPILKNQVIYQPFEAKCSNLNRIILPFYTEEKNSSGILTFNLYESNKEQKLVFSTTINIENLPPPHRIGTHDVDGILHYVWIPPQTDSRNKNYTWELRTGNLDPELKIGLYMNHRSNSQIQPVIIDGAVQNNSYVSFYSYCQFRFEWGNILKGTWKRLKREKLFLFLYSILLSGIVVAIKLSKKRHAGLE
jgi:hypothetical protein|tara:strand:+ start:3166 stop:3891 length:726 start_codon:yes stop_codon:yes gene_type:complete